MATTGGGVVAYGVAVILEPIDPPPPV